MLLWCEGHHLCLCVELPFYWPVIHESLAGNRTAGEHALTLHCGLTWILVKEDSLCCWQSDFERDHSGPRGQGLCHMVPRSIALGFVLLFRWRCLSLCMCATTLSLSFLLSSLAELHADCLGQWVIGYHFDSVDPAVDRSDWQCKESILFSPCRLIYRSCKKEFARYKGISCSPTACFLRIGEY